MPAPSPDHLLDQADLLIAGAGRPGAPRHTDLRRAVSAAYYALFHAVASQAADTLVGASQRQTPRYALVYRSVGHGDLRKVAATVAQDKILPEKYRPHAPRGFGEDLQTMAKAVLDLQEKRNLADYDPSYRARASEANVAVTTARIALTRFRAANGSLRKAFACLAVFDPR